VVTENLLFGTGEILDIVVAKRLLDCQPLARVEDQKLLDEAHSLFRSAGEEVDETFLLADLDVLEDVLDDRPFDGLHILGLGLAE